MFIKERRMVVARQSDSHLCLGIILVVMLLMAVDQGLAPRQHASTMIQRSPKLNQTWEICRNSHYAMENETRTREIIQQRFAWGKLFIKDCAGCLNEAFSLDPLLMMFVRPWPKTFMERIFFSTYVGKSTHAEIAPVLGGVYGNTCDHIELLGDDRSVCVASSVSVATSQMRDCVVYSIGSEPDFGFEIEVHDRLESPCQIHTFDCQVSQPRIPEGLPVNFHRICLGRTDTPIFRFHPWLELTELTGGHYPELVKMDIHGWEWVGLIDIMETAGETLRTTGWYAYPDQIAVRIYPAEIPWSYQDFGPVQVGLYFNYFFYAHGYVVASAKEVSGCTACFEILLVKLKC